MLGNILFLIHGQCTSIQNVGSMHNSKPVQFTSVTTTRLGGGNFPLILKIWVLFATEIHPLPVKNSWDA